MSELRVLYDALDHDGSDALDQGELSTCLRVCGLKEELSRELAGALLDRMGKARNDTLSFAEFAFAVLHFEVPVRSSNNGGSASARTDRRAFGAAKRTEPLFNRMMHGEGGGSSDSLGGSSQRSAFSRSALLQFKRKRLYEQLKSAAAAEEALQQQHLQQQQQQLQQA
jgi:hypothetical protein